MNVLRTIFRGPEGTGTDTGGGQAATGGETKAGGSTALPADGKGSNGKGSGDGNGVWNGLVKDAENLKTVESKGWSSPEDAIKSYRELESNYSKSAIKVPGKDAKPEDWDNFYKSVGRPEKPENYEFKLAEDVPDNFPYDDKSVESFRGISHKVGLRPEQAQALHDWFVKDVSGKWTDSLKATSTSIENAHKTIVEDWGDPQGAQYKRNVELADRTIRELGGKDKKALREELVEIGALAPDGKVMAPRLIMAFAKVGATLYAEDNVFGGVAATNNPFKDGPTENLTQQGQIIKNDPELARQLILAANKKPTDYGLKK